jgi:hypothetical protein
MRSAVEVATARAMPALRPAQHVVFHGFLLAAPVPAEIDRQHTEAGQETPADIGVEYRVVHGIHVATTRLISSMASWVVSTRA